MDAMPAAVAAAITAFAMLTMMLPRHAMPYGFA